VKEPDHIEVREHEDVGNKGGRKRQSEFSI